MAGCEKINLMPEETINEIFLSILKGGNKEYVDSCLKQFSNGDWATLKHCAIEHGIFPIFYSRLLKTTSEDIPSEAASDFKTMYLLNLKKNIILEKELLRVISLLNKAEIPVMPLKGVFLAKFLYDDLASRHTSCDLDLLVTREDIERTSRLLEGMGYCLDGIKCETKLCLRFNRAIQFAKKVPDLGIFKLDIHWNFCGRFVNTHVKEMWLGAKEAAWGGSRIMVPSTEDLLLLLSLKAILGFEFINMRYLADMDRLITNFGEEINWETLIGKAKKIGANAALFFSLCLCRDIFNSDTEEDILNSLRPCLIREKICGRYLARNTVMKYSKKLPFTYFWYYIMVSFIASNNIYDFISAIFKKNSFSFFKMIYTKTIRPLRLCKQSM